MQRDFDMQKSLMVGTSVRVKGAVILIKDGMTVTWHCSVVAFLSASLCLWLSGVFPVWGRASYPMLFSKHAISVSDSMLVLQACATMPHLDSLLFFNLLLHYCVKSLWLAKIWITESDSMSHPSALHLSICKYITVLSLASPPKERRKTPFPGSVW